MEWLYSIYIGGVLVVSGGIVLDVSGGVVVFVVSIGDAVESIVVLSEESAMFLDELHADAAIIIVPAKARLKIIFFIGLIVFYIHNNLIIIWFYFFKRCL